MKYRQKFSFYLVHSLSRVWLFATPWTAARQASLPNTNSWSFLKLMSIVLVMPTNHLILCHPLLLPPSMFPSIRVFYNELVLCIRWQSIGVSASTSALPMNIQDWSLLGWTGWISLPSKGLSRVFSSTTFKHHSLYYWSIIALQNGVSFSCIMKCISYMYMCIPFPLDLSPSPPSTHWSHQGAPSWASCAIPQLPTGYLFDTWVEDQIDSSPEEMYRCPRSIWEDAQHHSLLEKCKVQSFSC